MPAKSKAQQQMFGIAHAIQQGKRPAGSASSPATDVAKAAKPKDVKDFASTKTKNLPQKVKKEQIERIREYVTKVVREVLAENDPAFRHQLRIARDTLKMGRVGGSTMGGMTPDEARELLKKHVGEDATQGHSRGITTKMWKDAGEPFEIWLRYSQASSSQKDQVERLFAKKYPNIKEAAGKGRSARDPFFRHQLKIARDTLKMSKVGAQVMGGMNHDEARAFLKKHGLKEAYSRGKAVISIGRNGHIHWRANNRNYDADLPGKRDKKAVQRRVAQLKKHLWGYDIKIIDPEGMLSEATTEIRWVDGNLEKFYSRVTGSEAQVKKEIARIEAKLKSQGRRSSAGAISRRKIDSTSNKKDGPWTKVAGRTLK